MESEKNDDNPDQTPVSEPPSMNQNGENLIIVSNTMPFILNATILYQYMNAFLTVPLLVD